MKRYISTMLALLTVAATANAYDLTVGTSEHGTVTFSVGDAVTTTANEGDVVKINVAPESGWAVSDVSARIYTSWSSIKLKAAAPGVEKTIAVTGSGNEWTFTMKDGNADITVEYARIVQDSWIQPIADATYTGLELEPTLNVKDGDQLLNFATDYSVAYSNNVNAGTATVTITGIGNYCGEATATFTIARAPITEIVAPSAIENLMFNGEAQTLISAGSAVNGEMQYSLDGDNFSTELPLATNAGNYLVSYKVVADENHIDTEVQTVSVTIARAPITEVIAPSSIENLMFNGEAQTLIAAGSAINGEMQYSLDGENFSTELPSATNIGDYTVYFKIVGDENHLDVEAQTLAVTIVTNLFEIRYVVDGEDYKAYSLAYTSAITPEATPEKEGYTFSGWSEIPATMPANDVVVTGSFTINSYAIRYIVDGEEYKVDNLTFGAAIVLADAPTKEGFEFSGWSGYPEDLTVPAHDVEIVGTFTEINGLSQVAADADSAPFYNLLGQKVQPSRNGQILLHNRKKVVMKP
ncbi:MAG: hypothetical protein E7070_04830 [Bacteroidales bacterium]|nr:hypothetical protein [Bacteroidales bacterium]